MKRNDWKFTYIATVLADAAATKRDKHAEKLAWWEDKKREVMKQVAETGIEIQDSVASSYSNTKGMFGPQIKIDAGLQRDLTECQEKIMEHHGKQQDYGGWVEVLTGNPGDRLELDHADYLFFFGE